MVTFSSFSSIFSQLIFGNSTGSLSGKEALEASSWKDKSVCFDLSKSDLELNKGEQLIACFFPIEDIKGNQGFLGVLKLTNLRLIWICGEKKRVNLSIGWKTVTLIFEQNFKDPLGTPLVSLCVLTKYEATKYEFVFKKMIEFGDIWTIRHSWIGMTGLEKILRKNPLIKYLTPMYLDEPYEVVYKVWQSYKRTHAFRHCQINSSHLIALDSKRTTSPIVLELNQLIKLPMEEIIDVYKRIWRVNDLSQVCSGSLILTNIRVIWLNETFPLRNLSIPYIRIDSITLKQKVKISLNTLDYLTANRRVEFKVSSAHDDDIDRMRQFGKRVYDQLQNLLTLYKTKPRFGPESCEDCVNYMAHLKPIDKFVTLTVPLSGDFNFGPEMSRDRLRKSSFNIQDQEQQQQFNNQHYKQGEKTFEKETFPPDDDVDDDGELELNDYSTKLNNYLNDKPVERDRGLMFCKDLGLTIEKPANDMDLARIWRIDL